MEIIKIIEKKSDSLTKKQRMIAKYMLKHPGKMAYITLKDLSKETGVTEITVLNTCLALGYSGFNEVKYEFRKAEILQQKSDIFDQSDYYYGEVPSYEVKDKMKLLGEIGNEEMKMLSSFWGNVDLEQIFAAAQMIKESEKIFLCGRGVSYQIVEYLANRLSGCGIFAASVNTELNDNTYAILPSLDQDTLVISISYPDYYFMTDKVAEYAKSKNAKVLVMTDKKDANIAQFADILLTAPTLTRVFLNTISAVMFLSNLLASAIKIQMEEDKPTRREDFDKFF